MKLYTFFRSSASFRVRIALNLKGIAWESVPVNLPKSEHVEAKFKAINPQGLVPALDDSGKLLSQSLAIMEYLDEAYPGAKLLPADPAERAYVRAFSQLIACEIHPLNNLRVLKYLKRTYKLDEEGVNELVPLLDRRGFCVHGSVPPHREEAWPPCVSRPGRPWPTAAWCRRCSMRSATNAT